MKPLTDKQRALLVKCSERPQNSFDFGSATVSSLRKMGYIRPYRFDAIDGCVVNVITDLGRAALAGGA